MAGREAGRPRAGEDRFAAYLEAIVAALGHASRTDPARAYCTGLLLPGERKSVEPMAARIEPGRVQAKLVVNTDITEHKQLERKYLRAQRMESLGALAGGWAVAGPIRHPPDQHGRRRRTGDGSAGYTVGNGGC